MDIFGEGLNILISVLSVCALMVFKVFQSFSVPYTVIKILFAFFYLLTKFENVS